MTLRDTEFAGKMTEDFTHLEVSRSHPLVLPVKVGRRKGLVSENKVFGEGAGGGR